MEHTGKDARCRIGSHHYVGVPDDNPETRGKSHLECTRCGKVKDINEYESDSPRGGLAGG